MTIYREVTVTRDQRDDLQQIGTLLSRLSILGIRGLARYAATVQDISERWDESVETESTFPLAVLDRHIDAIAGVL